MPSRWIDKGRGSVRHKQPITVKDPEVAKARNRARVIARYWQSVGYLWFRSKRLEVQLADGRSIRYRQGFLTLTIPGISTADHKAVKRRILDPFFTYCRNVLSLRDYVWTAELQPGTGQIHFHCIINQFVPKDRIRRAWNAACERSGIVTMSPGAKPSTEIKACRSYNGSKSYAAKYLGKSLRSGEIVGRIWSGSHSVTGIPACTTNEIDSAYDMEGVLAELQANGHEWQAFDHSVRITRMETHKITKRRYPLIYRLIRAQLKHTDATRATAFHDANNVDARRVKAAAGSVAEDLVLPPQSAIEHMVPVRNRSEAQPRVVLPITSVGAKEWPWRMECPHVPWIDPWSSRYSAI